MLKQFARKVNAFDMKKAPARNFSDFFKNLEYSPDYAPNFDFGKKKLTSTGPKFDLMSPRKPYYRIAGLSDTSANFDLLSKSAMSTSPK